MAAQNSNEPLYRSGAAARLAGIPVETLRIWERRYSVVGPRVSIGRQRLYGPADVHRLSLIKQLVDMGHPIGSIASLRSDVLADMRNARWAPDHLRPADTQTFNDRAVRVALIGRLLTAEPMAQILSAGALEIVGRWSGPAEVIATPGDVKADIALIDLPTVRDADLEKVSETKAACGAAHAVVLYRFAASAVVRHLRDAGHVVARATSDATEIETLCLSVARPRRGHKDSTYLLDSAEPSPPRFDELSLAKLASTTSTIDCDCPRHLAELVLCLGSFERYSAECATHSRAHAALHVELQRTAGIARSIVDLALERLVNAEDLA